MAKDALADGLAKQVVERLNSGGWSVVAISGGPALQPIRKYLAGFDVEDLARAVIIIANREQSAAPLKE